MCWRFNPTPSSTTRQSTSTSSTTTPSSNEKLWRQVIKILKARLVYNADVWSFAFMYHDVKLISELFQRNEYILNSIGTYFHCALLSKDIAEYEFNQYQHLEYSPLLNARAHTLRVAGSSAGSGGDTKKLTIQNVQFSNQYRAFLEYLSNRVSGCEQFTPNQKLCLVYYLLLQDRIQEAKTMFDSIPPPVRSDDHTTTTAASSSSTSVVASSFKGSTSLSSSSASSCALQYDYFTCYFDFMNAVPTVALTIAKKYISYPVQKKRKLFEEIMNQLQEISARIDPDELQDEYSKDPLNRQKDSQDRDRELANLASSEPSLDFTFASHSELEINYENVSEIQVHLYKMNIELMFSANPFMISEQGSSGSSSSAASSSSFLYVTPNDTITLKNLPQNSLTGALKKLSPLVVKLPEQYLRTNCWIEVTNSAGMSTSTSQISAAGAGGY